MKKSRFLALAATAALTLLAVGCAQKPAATSETAPTDQPGAAQPGAAQPGAAQPGAAGEPGRRREPAPAERAPAGERARDAGSALTPAAPPKVASITLPQGTAIKVRTTTAISTKTAAPGDAFTASLMNDLVQDGVTIAPKGTEVRGKVVEADAGGRVKGRAVLSVRLTELEAASGPIALTTDSIVHEAAKSTKKDALKVGIGAGLGAAIGAIAGGGKGAAIGAAAGGGAGTGAVLLTRGDAAVLPAESAITFHLTAPAKVR